MRTYPWRVIFWLNRGELLRDLTDDELEWFSLITLGAVEDEPCSLIV